MNGDPSDTGDITLTLQERNAAVAIAVGSKNLTLVRALDREERTGPASVYVNVRCDRRHTADPVTTVPTTVLNSNYIYIPQNILQEYTFRLINCRTPNSLGFS